MSYSDIKTGLIPNRRLIMFTGIGIAVDVVYYGFLAREMVILFLLNFSIVFIISVILFYSHSLAGGDCKLIMVMSLLYPAGMYLTYGNSEITLFLTVCFAIVSGYFHMIVMSIWRIITGKNLVSKEYVKSYIKGYIKSYLIALEYVALVNLMGSLADQYVIRIWPWMVLTASIIVAWLSGRVRFLRKKAVLLVCGVMVLVFSLFERVFPFSTNPHAYIFTAILILCQMTIRTDLYEVVPTETVKKGMILSALSSMTMQNSGVKGLPGLSTEDLKSRISEEEAESIKRWGRTSKGLKEISIVKKIPFAIFITLGFLVYLIIWGTVS